MCDEYDYIRAPAVVDLLSPGIAMHFWRRYDALGGTLPAECYYDDASQMYRFNSVFFRDGITKTAMTHVFENDEYARLFDDIEGIALAMALSDPTCGVGA